MNESGSFNTNLPGRKEFKPPECGGFEGAAGAASKDDFFVWIRRVEDSGRMNRFPLLA